MYREDSAEAEAGRRGERAVDAWARLHGGWAILKVSSLGPAAFVHCPDGKLIALDRLCMKEGITKWCDVKWKTGPVHFQKLDVMRHGIDKRNWEHYLEVERLSGIPAALGIVEVKRHRASGLIEPRLLWGDLQYLAQHMEPSIGNNEMVYWDVGVFDVLGPIDIGEEPPPGTPLNLSPWEQRDRCGRLRLPPERRAQLELDYKPHDDFSKSIDACYEAVRERVKAGGETWKPK